MSNYQYLNFSIADAVATIELNRPDSGNAFDLPLATEFNQVTQQCLQDRAVRAVIITGAGKLFCAGGDLGSMAAAGDDLAGALKALTDQCHAAYRNILNMRAPVVVAVNGAAAGIGMSLALVGDLTLASDKAGFMMAYTAAGLSPDGGATYWLPRIVGTKRAKELMLTNRKLSAAEAAQWGIVNQVVPADELLEQAQKLAARLAKGPTDAFGSVKNMLNQSDGNDLQTQLDLEAVTIGRNGTSADGQEGIAAFLAKRRPDFSGN